MVDGRPGVLAGPGTGDGRPATGPCSSRGGRRGSLPARAVGALVAAYGALASTALLVVLVLGDGTSASYTLALFGYAGLLPAAPLLLAALVARRWRAALACVAPVVVLALVWGATAVPGRAGTGSAERDLRVATYNRSHDTPLDGVLGLASTWSPDVLLLQEVSAADVDALARDLAARYPHVASTTGRGGDTAVLSRWPVVSQEPVTGLPADARAQDVVVLDVAGRGVAVIAVHLASPCVLCADGGVARNPSGTTAEAAEVRAGEAVRDAAVVSDLRARGLPVVLAGDMNSAELNEPLRLLTGEGLVDVHRAVGAGPQLTRGPGPGVARVDAVLVDGLVAVADAEGDRAASTHSPVIADLDWSG